MVDRDDADDKAAKFLAGIETAQVGVRRCTPRNSAESGSF
jgi:hypothetical protein